MALLLVPVLATVSQAQAPGWATGAFRGSDPATGGVIELNIAPDGSVAAVMNGEVITGTFKGQMLRLNGKTSRVRRTPNGLRTTRTDNRQRVDFVRVTETSKPLGNPPEWAVGTFSGSNPIDGSRITLTITENGKVTANIGGNAFYGSVSVDMLNMNGAMARITRTPNGITTTRTDNGESITYIREGSAKTNTSGPRGEVPVWAVGTFWGRDPDTDEEISITIATNGNVIENLGSGNNRYGTMYKEIITFDGVESTVSRIRNGIRMTRADNGQRTEYFLR